MTLAKMMSLFQNLSHSTFLFLVILISAVGAPLIRTSLANNSSAWRNSNSYVKESDQYVKEAGLFKRDIKLLDSKWAPQKEKTQSPPSLLPSDETLMTSNWVIPNQLGQPAHVPSPIGQEDASFLERYLKNFDSSRPMDSSNQDSQSINLAGMNARATSNRRHDDKESPPIAETRPTIPLKPLRSDSQRRLDALKTIPVSNADLVVRKGKVDDVTHPLRWSPTNILPAGSQLLSQKASSLAHHKTVFLDALTQNCVTRSTPRMRTCEDHLIKRLSQDATEGRTVIDVGRRLCCALFWHKDCVDRIVLETCPDSNPAAADYLLGTPRKMDLTMSCRMFNRDGCNGADTGREIREGLGILIAICNTIFINALSQYLD